MSDSDWIKEVICMVLNEADVEAQKYKNSNTMYDIGYRDGISFVTHKLDLYLRVGGQENDR